MTRQFEKGLEEAQAKRAALVLWLCGDGLYSSIGHAGGVLLGLSAKIQPGDCLVTLRAEFPAGRMIAFVGGDSLAACIVKADREAKGDRLRWKVDRYAQSE